MNKILVLLLISFASFAQIKKHTLTAGSRVLSISKTDDYKAVTVSPSFGIFIANNVEFGVSLSSSSINYFNPTYKDFYDFEVSNYLVKYFGKKKIHPYLIGQIEWGKIQLKLGAGVQYMINDNLGVFVGGSVGGFRLLKSNISAGFSFYIPRKK